MSRSLPQFNRRVLVIDDSLAIHEDFRKVLCPELEEVDPFETRAFGASDGSNRQVPFEVEFASQGQQGLESPTTIILHHQRQLKITTEAGC